MPTIPAALVRPAMRALDAMADALIALSLWEPAKQYQRAHADLYEARDRAMAEGRETEVSEELAGCIRIALEAAGITCFRARALSEARAWWTHLRRWDDAMESQQEPPPPPLADEGREGEAKYGEAA